jgi:hypothetical protein
MEYTHLVKTCFKTVTRNYFQVMEDGGGEEGLARGLALDKENIWLKKEIGG